VPEPLLSDPVALLASDPSIVELARALNAGKRTVATGSVGSSTTLVAAAVARLTQRPIVLVLAHADDADEAEAELDGLVGPGFARRFPPIESSPGESAAHVEQFAERLRTVRTLLGPEAQRPRIVLAPIAALMQLVPDPARLDTLALTLARGDARGPQALIRWLDHAGYRRVDAVEEPGHFALRGGILDVFPPATPELASAVRLDFFGDELDRLHEIDLDTMGIDRALERVELIAVKPELLSAGDTGVSVLGLIDPGAIALLHETMEVVEQGRGYFERVLDQRGIVGPPKVLKLLAERFCTLGEINQFSAGAADAQARVDLPVAALPQFDQDAAQAFAELAQIAAETPAQLFCRNEGEAARAGELLAQHAPGAPIERCVKHLHRGFLWRGDHPAALVPYAEVLHRYDTRRTGRLRSARAMDTFLDFAPGDYVVHAEHGIARFAGLTTMKPRVPAGAAHDPDNPEHEEYLTLEFSGSSKLHVPCTQIDLVQKYVGGFAGKPPLSSLGGTKWKNQKARVAESVRDLASEMLRVRAARQHMPGVAFPADTPWQAEFEAEFPYEETEDQLAALSEIKKDMTSARPMDRLICGDVGFGKTELAIRAAFKACEFGKQVAVLVPTTVLAEQHERTFRARFADYPFRVESLSRFKTGSEIGAILRDLRKGQIDLIIGTHRLLSKDVKFADLGLVVVDEEQRFGVEHKEALLQLRMTVDVLTLSATPIPRTLHMAMLGLRDISSLTTPPADRRAIVTEVIPFNPRRVQQAIDRELAREGQVYYVHNRVHDIQSVADEVQKLAPSAKIVVGHGQMSPHELEEVILKFVRRQADILVSTTIIESGIDIPTANTMVIADADRFGLADLHQLRGRVGRSKHRAYCYLLLPDDRAVKEVAQKRLKAIEQYAMLGAGFKIAMRDLEIRGAGNILGAEQSGHIAAVGYEMYCRLLDQAVSQLTRDNEPEPVEHVALDLGLTGLIPKPYIPSDARRMEAYRRLAQAASDAQLDTLVSDLTSAYGPPPRVTQRLVDLARLRAAARSLAIRTIARRGERLVFLAERPGPVAERLRAGPGDVRVIDASLAETNARTPSGVPLAEVYFTPPKNFTEPSTLLRLLPRRLLGQAPADARPHARPDAGPPRASTPTPRRSPPGLAEGTRSEKPRSRRPT
jgi:transcription-repair coupling factor (superfamily II helicase)